MAADRKDLEGLFAGAREELSSQPSVSAGLAGRLGEVRMAPRRRRVIPWVAAAGVLALGLVWMMRPAAPVARPYPLTPVSVDLGDVLITQRLACALSDRAVLVAWTTTAGVGAVEKPTRHHRYLEVPLRTAAAEGGVFHCSLFIAEGDVRPPLVPPTIVALLPEGRMVGFAASPTFVATPDLAAAVRSSAPAGVPGVTMKEIDAALAAHASSM